MVRLARYERRADRQLWRGTHRRIFKTSPAFADIAMLQPEYGHHYMQASAGSLSYDGRWIWNGARWVPAISPDGRWWWNGIQWVALATPNRLFWQPSWRSKDTIAVAAWLTFVPAVLAAVTLVVGLLAHLTPSGMGVAIVTAYAAWAFIGGFTVRPRGRWWEVVLVTGALVAFLVLVDMAAYMTVVVAGNDQPGDDNGVAVGMVFLVLLVFPPTVIPVALGRLIRRALARSNRTA